MRMVVALLLACVSFASGAGDIAPVYQMQFELTVGKESPRPMNISAPAGQQFTMNVGSSPPVEGDLSLSGMILEAGRSKGDKQVVDFSLSTMRYTAGSWKLLSESSLKAEVGSLATLQMAGGEHDVSLRASFAQLSFQAPRTNAECPPGVTGASAKDCCQVGCPNPPPGRTLTCCNAYCCSDMVGCGAGCCPQ